MTSRFGVSFLTILSVRSSSLREALRLPYQRIVGPSCQFREIDDTPPRMSRHSIDPRPEQ
ncbi:hypothetical protein ACHAW6_013094 [Cyclotella cf. meneghiniana]